MDEKDWLILKILAEKKSITKAAKILAISQPALSNRLQQMETRFATPLVIRTQKGIHFTPEGDYLVEQARKYLFHMETVDNTINAMKGHISGTLNIGSARFCSKYLMPELLKTYKDKYPEIQFKVTSENSDNIFKLLYEDKVQLALVRGNYVWDQKIELFEENMYIASNTPFKDFKDVTHHPFIEYVHNYYIKVELYKWWRSNFGDDPNIAIMVDDIDTACEMVVRGLGWAFVSSWVLNRYKNLYTYPLTFKNGRPVTRKTWLLYTENGLKNKTVKSFFDFVCALDYSQHRPC